MSGRRCQRRGYPRWTFPWAEKAIWGKCLLSLRRAKFISHTGAQCDVSQVYRINPSGRKLFAGKLEANDIPELDASEINLTEWCRFCHNSLAEVVKTVREVSLAARKAEVRKHDNAEWADKYLAFLRKIGLAQHTGEQRHGALISRLTEKGKKLLAGLG